MANGYPFPLLEISELVRNFKKALPELTLTETDFRNPKSDRWQMIYTVVLEMLTDVPPEHIFQPSLESQSKLQYPELYEEALPLFMLAVYMQRVLCACGIDDFTLWDIIQPSPKRLRKNMSAILNFLYFRSERMAVYDEMKIERASQLEKRDTFVKENMDMKEKINRIRVEQVEQQPIVSELDSKIEEVQQQIKEMSERTAQKKKALRDTNVRISEKKALVAQLKEEVAIAKEESSRLSGQIVQSPERMKDTINRMRQQVEHLKETKEERKAKVATLQTNKDDMAQIEAGFDQALDLVSKVKVQIDQKKDVEHEIQELQERLVEKQDEVEDLEAQEQNLNRMIAGKQEKFSKMTLSHNNKKQSLENILQLLRQERDIIVNQRSEDAVQREALLQAERQLQDSEAKDLARHSALMEHMRDKYEVLLEQLEVYHEKLAKLWNKAHNTMKM